MPSPAASTNLSALKITNRERLAVYEKPNPYSPTDSDFIEPIDLAANAYTLIKQSLQKYHPHNILIEH